MDIQLAKAIYAAGFKAGQESGSDAATAHEWGSNSQLPQTAEASWLQDIQWRLDTDTCYKLDIDKIEDWDTI